MLQYRSVDEYVAVDIDKLRPKDSYKKLLEQRTHPIDALIHEYGAIPENLLQERTCPTCGSAESKKELEKDHLTLVRCSLCGLVYVNPIFDETHYYETYGSTEYQRIVRDLGEASHDYRVRRFGSERVETMAGYLTDSQESPVVYLDVGCSTGFVVEAASERGWRAYGIDLNPSAVEFGCKRGLDLKTIALDEGEFSPESFDAISLFDVLEHLVNPAETVERCFELLRPGGILYLYVPNYDSSSRLLMGKDAHFIWPTHHLNYYTPITLGEFLVRYGLSIELVQTEGLDFVDYIWQRKELHQEDMGVLERIADTLQFFANAGGYGKNLRVLARRPV